MNRKFRARLFLVAIFGFTLPLCSQPSLPGAARTILLWTHETPGKDSLDQQAFEATLQSIGLHPSRLDPGRLSSTPLDSNTLLIAPRAAANLCPKSDLDRIIQQLKRGLALITDGESPLSAALGVRLGRPVRVSLIRDRLRPEIHPYWSDNPEVPWIAAAPGRSPKILYTDKATGHPLAVVMHVGSGRCLYLAPLFDPRTGRGYGRFATLPDAIVKLLERRPPLSRQAADAYFDAGYRFGSSPDSLARTWKRWGIRTVHAAAWYAYNAPPFDYRSLIDACHRNGVLVYAWLEWPYIGKGFWDAHPGWRQKNALLKDAHFDFLYLMDLQNPECMNHALANLDSLLSLDWDGVDVAEFTLTGAGKEALRGPSRPEWFTGFTDYCRKEFKQLQGFDPVVLFDHRSSHYWQRDTAGLEAFYRYRIDVNIATQHRLFSELHRIREKHQKSLELMLTIADNSSHPEFEYLLGFDTKRTLALLGEYDVTLQIEDPYQEWTKPPERYIAVVSYYRRLLDDRPFVIDVNIVQMKPDRRNDFSTWLPIGAEVFECWKYASGTGSRACFYCESSVSAGDWELMPYAMAADAIATTDSTGWLINTPMTVMLHEPPGNDGFLLDDQPWFAYGESGVIIPAGRHTLRRAKHAVDPHTVRLVSTTGELLDVHASKTECRVDYTSRTRCALSFSRLPSIISIDGVLASLPVSKTGKTCTIVAPPGKHLIVISIE